GVTIGRRLTLRIGAHLFVRSTIMLVLIQTVGRRSGVNGSNRAGSECVVSQLVVFVPMVMPGIFLNEGRPDAALILRHCMSARAKATARQPREFSGLEARGVEPLSSSLSTQTSTCLSDDKF